LNTKRKWGGLEDEERRLVRRQRLLEAAVELYGRDGYRSTTVRSICRQAGLTERYFYESFSNSEALLLAAYEVVCAAHVVDILTADDPALPAVDRVERMLTAYFQRLRAYPEGTRVFLLEITNISPSLDAAFEESRTALSEFIVGVLDPDRRGPMVEQPMLRRGLTGGILDIALCWSSAGFDHPIEEVVQAALALCMLGLPEDELRPSGRRA
jgi:AcrR family transcriptional regulator